MQCVSTSRFRWLCQFALIQFNIYSASSSLPADLPQSGCGLRSVSHACVFLRMRINILKPTPNTAPDANKPSICTSLTFSVNCISPRRENTIIRAGERDLRVIKLPLVVECCYPSVRLTWLAYTKWLRRSNLCPFEFNSYGVGIVFLTILILQTSDPYGVFWFLVRPFRHKVFSFVRS